MERILECLMLVCFGLSWPISVYKSYTSRSTKGKSVYCTVAILLGYLCGIAAKIIGGDISFVLILYGLNFAVVSVDFMLYFRNRRCER